MNVNPQYELQIYDYQDGYKFRVLCRLCGHGWYEWPAEILLRSDIHDRMYLEELEHRLTCINCKQHRTKITPIRIQKQHHFVGGLA